MSRLGKLPVAFNAKVKADYKNQVLSVKGPVGELSMNIPLATKVVLGEGSISVDVDFNDPVLKVQGGTIRALIKCMIDGVSTGFKKQLELVGVGYRAQLAGQKLTLAL